jgi:hypothetical protein
MNASWMNRLLLALAAAALLIAVIVVAWSQPAQAAREEGGSSGSPRYSVIETEGHNLIVTDNRTNTLYFYTIDKDKKIGSELILRGTVDLKQVGKKVIKPMTVKGGE